MRKRLSMLAALVVGVTCMIAPTSAHAAKADQCWYNVETGESACFTTFAAVVADLSGGQVQVSGGASTLSATQSSAVTAAAASTYVIGVMYEDASYSGASISYTAGGTCDADATSADFEVSNVGSSWNDRISSFHGYNGCRVKLWSNTNFGGYGYGYYGDKASINATINDETSSIQFS